MTITSDPCGCQWQDRPVIGIARVTQCAGHAAGNHLYEEAVITSRDSRMQHLLDIELDHLIRASAHGRRVEIKQALGPERKHGTLR